ncbi:MAG: hypothetical protein CMI52_04950 [Parcubacteria group bacterium]|nr:hypothetical protein [Parcubacteria group bacterium]
MLLMPYAAWAETMSSTNYHMQLDSFGSGARSTSTNYSLKDDIGVIGSDTSTSTNYQVNDGIVGAFQDGVLSASVSAGSVDLGTLSTITLTQGRIEIIVTSDAMSGYTIRASEDQPLSDGAATIDAVADGEVTIGSEEYGLGTAGTSGQYNSSDVGISSALTIIASASDPVTSESTAVYFKAAISGSTTAGSYSHIVTFSTVSNF